ncbi:glycerophosphoinositol inositolphosphodiesterase GDPD2 [Fundulus heteroclitus]|uniref:glycerophosphoinositol inositolphosphodiesterase GDPD2 n=1 Tax=Fundulus heteroclitus TaxID=8078 RepID=UPI00165AD768|nr:glycerophosphoinositol inositolphosphodiesterase GDPD2 [Fundulus heteroclitus]
MTTLDSCCRVCSRLFFSCRLKKPSDGMKNRTCCWFTVVSVGALLSLFAMYSCLIIYNDRDNVNWMTFSMVRKHINFFMVAMIIFAVFASYCVLLLLFALVQVALREKLHLHWLHVIFICLGVIIISAWIVTMAYYERLIVTLSLQYMAPFLQFGAVGALTLLSWFVFRAYQEAKKESKFLIAAVFLVVSAFIFLCPLLISSPCLMEIKDLKKYLPRPKLYGHRGAPMLAPENTMMSFERGANECNLAAFETDVQVSKDGIPFLMHDHKGHFLKRTTNVEEEYTCSKNLSFDKLKTLNAGKLFVEVDPFRTVHLLTGDQKKEAENQHIPSLKELLNLTKKYNIPVMFDLYGSTDCDNTNDTVRTVETIKESNVNSTLIYWLHKNESEHVKTITSDFIQVYNDKKICEKKPGCRLNLEYSHLTMDEIRELRKDDVNVNLYVVNERWLFSLLWCANVSSVTTNACQDLNRMEQPDWTMAPSAYRLAWILADALSILLMIGLFFCQRSCHRRSDVNVLHRIPLLRINSN